MLAVAPFNSSFAVSGGTVDDPYPNNEFNTHVYGLGYRYDLNGRRSEIIHPANIRNGSTKYSYYEWGGLKEVVDPLGYVYGFSEVPSQRLAARTFPGGGVDTLRYDADGRLIKRKTLTPYAGIRGDELRYDARGKIVFNESDNGVDQGEKYWTWYTGFGHVAGTLWTKGQTPGIIEEFEPDALGNVQWKRTYIPGTG